MKQEKFIKQNEKRWDNFKDILFSLKKRKNNNTIKFPYLYRRLCHDLNIAKANNFDIQLVEMLNQLVVQGHQYLYKPSGIYLSNIISFIIYDFPNAIRKEFRLVLLCIVLFYGPMSGIFIVIQDNPDIIYTLMSQEDISNFESMYDPASGHFLRPREKITDAEMFGFYILNNISISFRTFAGGVLAGFGSLFFLLLNGIFIGAAAGHISNLGYYETFFPFIIGHGAFELTAIVFSAVAGLKLGWAVIAPGRNTREQSLKKASHHSIPIIFGSVIMLFLAAIIEAFWSPYPMPIAIKYSVGAALWIMVILYFILTGRKRGSK